MAGRHRRKPVQLEWWAKALPVTVKVIGSGFYATYWGWMLWALAHGQAAGPWW
ncbi:hypothetical protein [Streptomyces sp. NPDC051909]|uniref:hypothetical protein n=1 Tax=Streptomyces sp. NPDC051909 TaxID=3154944 RepID=UPI00342B9ACF